MTGVAVPQRTAGGAVATVEAEDNGQLLLDHGNGVLSSVTAGFTMQQTRSPAIEVYGAEGTVQMLGDDWAPQGYELWTRAVGAWRPTRTSIRAGCGPTVCDTRSSAFVPGPARSSAPSTPTTCLRS